MRFITVCLFIIFAQAFFCAAGASEGQASCFRGTALVKETAEGAELYYDFGGNDGSYALCEKKAEGAEGADTLEFTVVKPEDHRVNLRVMDAGGEVFQKPLQLPACPYPLKVRVFLGDYPEHWGGNNDGVFDGAPSAVGFAVLKGMSVSSRGKAVFAGLRFLKAGAPPAPKQRRLEARGKAEKGKAVFTVKVSGDPGPAVLRAVFRNSRGGFEGAEERRILVGKDCCETFAIKTDTFTEGEFYLDGAGRFSSEITCGPSADYKRACAVVMPPPFSEEGPAPGPALGMGVYLYRRNDPRDDYKELRQAAELARRCGVRWSREEFTWPAIEKERGKPDFSFYDRMVAEAEKAGINIYGLICYYADWAQPAADDANREFARFAGQLAERYKDKIRFWEIWNEPNGGFYPWDVNKYYGLHKMCYEAIKKVDPSLQVIGCSSAAGSVEFIRGAGEAGCVFDIASSH
ncbi:MAG: cellulase family glycosylhydrolase, partial [Abditibacteriota bacterium]|nr:cellulase family glycosylhydrolase [Abditibacteriota bacterium]